MLCMSSRPATLYAPRTTMGSTTTAGGVCRVVPERLPSRCTVVRYTPMAGQRTNVCAGEHAVVAGGVLAHGGARLWLFAHGMVAAGRTAAAACVRVSVCGMPARQTAAAMPPAVGCALAHMRRRRAGEPWATTGEAPNSLARSRLRPHRHDVTRGMSNSTVFLEN